MSHVRLLAELHALGLIGSTTAACRPLTGGVSSDIVLVDDGKQKLVVKRALPQLRVRDEWLADVSRNATEQKFLRYMASVLPGSVPNVLYAPPDGGYFVMEYLGDGLANWKDQLMAGQVDAGHAQRAGETLAALHAASWNDAELRQEFATQRNFFDLRVAPYLLTSAERRPEVAAELRQEAARLMQSELCLVHGDFSPKNLLVGPSRLVMLDAEVACYGDPAFDAAFLLNHLLLKALVHRHKPQPVLALARGFWTTYCAGLPAALQAHLEERVARLLPMLMLARVVGKSPVEYLDDQQLSIVNDFSVQQIRRPVTAIEEVLKAWQVQLADIAAT